MSKKSAFDVGPSPEEVRRVAQEARDLPREQLERGVLGCLGLVVAVWAVTVAVVATKLPERVPTHWSGETPDGWSSRTGAIALFVLTPIAISALLVLVSGPVMRWPQSINAPQKEEWLRTPQRLRTLERLMREDMVLLSALIFALFALITATTGWAAHQPGGAMPGWLIGGVLLLFVVGMLTFLVTRMLGSRYTPTDTVD